MALAALPSRRYFWFFFVNFFILAMLDSRVCRKEVRPANRLMVWNFRPRKAQNLFLML